MKVLRNLQEDEHWMQLRNSRSIQTPVKPDDLILEDVITDEGREIKSGQMKEFLFSKQKKKTSELRDVKQTKASLWRNKKISQQNPNSHCHYPYKNN